MFSFGLAFLFRNAVYLLFSMVMGYLGYKMYKLKKVGVIVFLIVWMLPYYDLFIQKGIKTYYETFKMNNTIYAYPEKDADGKIESLGIGKVDSEISNYFFNQEKTTKYGMEKKKFISGFVELYIFDSFEEVINKQGDIEYKKIKDVPMGYIRLYLNKNFIYYEKIKNESEYQARYQVKNIIDKGFFYDEVIAEFWDTKKNILLAQSMGIGFNNGDNYNDKFRNKYLLFRGPSGISMTIQGIGNYREIYNELFFNTKSKNK